MTNENCTCPRTLNYKSIDFLFFPDFIEFGQSMKMHMNSNRCLNSYNMNTHDAKSTFEQNFLVTYGLVLHGVKRSRSGTIDRRQKMIKR